MLQMNALPLASTSSSDTASSLISMIAMFAVIIVVFYFLLIRPQRKKDKATQKMRNQLQVGDDITTLGGIVGRVVTIKDDTVVLETGADRSKIRIKKWAIQSCDTVHEDSK